MFDLTPKQAKFARLNFETGKPSESYRACYDADNMTDATVSRAANELLSNPKLIEYRAELEDQAKYVASLNVGWLLKQYMQIATANVNELVESRRVCCRHCYGIDHAYQWIDELEWTAELLRVLELNETIEKRNKRSSDPQALAALPTLDGGVGFWGTKEPHADCPKCFGNGTQEAYIHDTRKLKGAAKLLYAGIKQTANGFEIKTRDQDGALAWLAKYLGVDVKSLQISAPGGGPIGIANFKAEDLTDDQLAALIAKPNE